MVLPSRASNVFGMSRGHARSMMRLARPFMMRFSHH